MAVHHVSRSSHAYKHAFRLNLTLIGLNICLKLCPEFIFFSIYNHVRILISLLESQRDNSVQTSEEIISLLRPNCVKWANSS